MPRREARASRQHGPSTLVVAGLAAAAAASALGFRRVATCRAAAVATSSPWAHSDVERWRLARHLARRVEVEGWAQTTVSGLAPSLYEAARAELPRAEERMVPGLTDSRDKSRTDRIMTLQTEAEEHLEAFPGLLRLCAGLESVVMQVARELRLSTLQMKITGRYEPMLACYEAGGRYLSHVDSNSTDDRLLTAIYYLNEDWDDSMGGALRLHGDGEHQDLLPARDSLVIFRADRVMHEVRPTKAKRVALSTWFCGTCSDIDTSRWS